MKLPSFLAFLTILGVRAQQQHEYLGFNVTTAADGDFALCGTNLEGCASLPPNARGCNVQLGTLDELGTPSQQWIYQDGLLKPKVQPTHWYSPKESCLGPDVEGELDFGRSYLLTLQHCPDDNDDDDDEVAARHMRFVMVDGRVQSLAPVVVPSSSDDDTDNDTDAEEISMITHFYCMSINGNVVMQSARYPITLEPCDSQNMLQQGFQSYGTVQPFIYSLQDVWGISDVVELAFAVGNYDSVNDPVNDPVMTVTIFNQREEKVHSLQATTVSGILSFSVSDLVGGDDDTTATGEYIAKFVTNNDLELSAAFSVSTCTKPISSLGMVMAAVGLFVGLILLAAVHYSFARKQMQSAMQEDEETVVEAMDDDDEDDEGIDTTKENDDDGAETLSQATTSIDLNVDTELVLDQA